MVGPPQNCQNPGPTEKERMMANQEGVILGTMEAKGLTRLS